MKQRPTTHHEQRETFQKLDRLQSEKLLFAFRHKVSVAGKGLEEADLEKVAEVNGERRHPEEQNNKPDAASNGPACGNPGPKHN
jgi:hypothetical protein